MFKIQTIYTLILPLICAGSVGAVLRPDTAGAQSQLAAQIHLIEPSVITALAREQNPVVRVLRTANIPDRLELAIPRNAAPESFTGVLTGVPLEDGTAVLIVDPDTARFLNRSPEDLAERLLSDFRTARTKKNFADAWINALQNIRQPVESTLTSVNARSLQHTEELAGITVLFLPTPADTDRRRIFIARMGLLQPIFLTEHPQERQIYSYSTSDMSDSAAQLLPTLADWREKQLRLDDAHPELSGDLRFAALRPVESWTPHHAWIDLPAHPVTILVVNGTAEHALKHRLGSADFSAHDVPLSENGYAVVLTPVVPAAATKRRTLPAPEMPELPDQIINRLIRTAQDGTDRSIAEITEQLGSDQSSVRQSAERILRNENNTYPFFGLTDTAIAGGYLSALITAKHRKDFPLVQVLKTELQRFTRKKIITPLLTALAQPGNDSVAPDIIELLRDAAYTSAQLTETVAVLKIFIVRHIQSGIFPFPGLVQAVQTIAAIDSGGTTGRQMQTILNHLNPSAPDHISVLFALLRITNGGSINGFTEAQQQRLIARYYRTHTAATHATTTTDIPLSMQRQEIQHAAQQLLACARIDLPVTERFSVGNFRLQQRDIESLLWELLRTEWILEEKLTRLEETLGGMVELDLSFQQIVDPDSIETQQQLLSAQLVAVRTLEQILLHPSDRLPGPVPASHRPQSSAAI